MRAEPAPLRLWARAWLVLRWLGAGAYDRTGVAETGAARLADVCGVAEAAFLAVRCDFLWWRDAAWGFFGGGAGVDDVAGWAGVAFAGVEVAAVGVGGAAAGAACPAGVDFGLEPPPKAP
jgi:hypothetical protein